MRMEVYGSTLCTWTALLKVPSWDVRFVLWVSMGPVFRFMPSRYGDVTINQGPLGPTA